MLDLTRRDLVVRGTAALAAYAVLHAARAGAFPSRPGEVVIPWLDQPAENPVPHSIQNQLVWEHLHSWITPNDEFFSIAHFDRPVIDPATWTLEIGGLVRQPLRLTLADIQARPRQDVTFTIECSGNDGLPFFNGGIGNANWAGTPLAPLLEEAGVLPEGIEVVFWGMDAGDVEVRDMTFRQNFARSMSLVDAQNPDLLLAYEMNGAPLRLIAPGWYGIASVKWLKRIELRDRRLENLFMGRDYVTIREEEHDGETVWTETSVGPARLKSAPARVTRSDEGLRITGAAWGAPIDRVEVQVDDGPWQPAVLDDSEQAEFAWTIWSLDWPEAAPGEHSVTSRAIDTEGNVQPTPNDPLIAGKHTYWESNGQITRHVRIEP